MIWVYFLASSVFLFFSSSRQFPREICNGLSAEMSFLGKKLTHHSTITPWVWCLVGPMGPWVWWAPWAPWFWWDPWVRWAELRVWCRMGPEGLVGLMGLMGPNVPHSLLGLILCHMVCVCLHPGCRNNYQLSRRRGPWTFRHLIRVMSWQKDKNERV